MSKKKLVQPYSDPHLPVPPLRYDVNLIPVKHQGEDWILFHDPLQYATPDIALSVSIAQYFQVFDGRTSLEVIYKRYFKKSGFSLSDLTGLITHLDGNRVLHSAFFKQYSEHTENVFETSTSRAATCLDSSYPSDAVKLEKWLDKAFAEADKTKNNRLKALYAPHIDFRVGMKTYVNAFSKIRNAHPRRIVIIGTSHYAGYYENLYENRPFIISGKDQQTPFGTLRADKKIMKEVSTLDLESYGISLNDRAHRVEHSIELHTVLSQYLWGNNIEIISVLVGSLEEFMRFPKGNQGKQLKKTASFIRSLDDGETLFLISGDQAHFGKKFGDVEPAKEILDAVRMFDKKYLNHASAGETAMLVELMQMHEDEFRICGFPPLMLYLSAFPEARGEIIDYDFWDEEERESGVTFASIGYQ